MSKVQTRRRLQTAGKARKTQVPEADAMPAMPWLDQGSTVTESRALRKQIDKVVDSIRRTGDPPAGVRQGGRGVFGNAGGALPVKPHGYYTESDVWPGAGERGVERLVVGGRGEAYFSNDHYATFRKVPR